MIVEGVRYWRFVVRFVGPDGKRRRRVLWAPAACFLGSAIAGMADADFGGGPLRVTSVIGARLARR